MAINFDEFDKMVDFEGLKADLAEAAARVPGEYVDVPCGTYEVKLSKLELGTSKKGDPMAKVWFKVLEGDYKGETIFMNQVCTQGFQIHIINTLMRELGTEKEDLVPQSFTAYAKIIEEVFNEIKGKHEYILEYGENSKGFKTYKILQVLPVTH